MLFKILKSPSTHELRKASFAVLIAGILCSASVFPGTSIAEDKVEFIHRGIQISGLPKPKDVFFDIEVTSAKKGADLVRDALDILYEGSAFNAKAIERLKAAGNVVIIYDPAFPRRELSQITIAAFLPDFYQKDGNAKDFLTIVGRFGGKWTARELAPVLAHELTGHGMQHLRGRLEHVREVDLECEAYMYQEKAYQDLKFDKDTREIITFRQTLERHWCADFKTWQKKHRPKNSKHWDKLHPDIPRLLKDYLVYIDALRKSGVAGKAVRRAKAAQNNITSEQIALLAISNDPAAHFQLGRIYSRGIGVEANKQTALNWFEKAAEAGHPRAQFELARIYWQGDGVPLDKVLSAQWAKVSAENNVTEAEYLYGAMLVNGDGVARDLPQGRAWISKAAKKEHKGAVAALKKLPPK